MSGRPVLSSAAIRASEQAAIESGTSVESLMEQAGRALAEAAFRFGGPLPALVLCGPGNNGGDGFVAAGYLARRGVEVRTAVIGEASNSASQWARSNWTRAIEELGERTQGAPLIIDALFGTGLKRGLEEPIVKQLFRLCEAATVRVACDLPSGVQSDSGECLSPVPEFDLTVTFGALKPAHLLYPAMYRCGRVALADIGIGAATDWHEIGPPQVPPVNPGLHKYTRGLVHALAGKMPGAIRLAATAAARSGAGYVRVSTSKPLDGMPASIVQTDTAEVNDPRIGCLLVGPGMGDIPPVLTLALTSKAPKVIDADAITHLGDAVRLKGQDAVITPHEGEFRKLFGDMSGTKTDQLLAAARHSDAIIVYKGADTLVGSPDGRLGFRPPAPGWLATAGTGDVLAGIIAALRAQGMPAFDAACAGVWLHTCAAQLAGPQMIADDLANAIPKAFDLLS